MGVKLQEKVQKVQPADNFNRKQLSFHLIMPPGTKKNSRLQAAAQYIL